MTPEDPMDEMKAFQRVCDYARKAESMCLVTVMVDDDRREVRIRGAGDECALVIDMLNMGAVIGRECATEVEDWGDAISLIDGAVNGAVEELAFGPKGVVIRSKVVFSDGTKIVWGRILFSRGQRTELIRYAPYTPRLRG